MTSADPALQEVRVLYTEHHGWLYGWLRRRLGNSGDAADLAHDTFVRILARRSLLTRPGSESRALLTHIARGLVIDHWRRQQVEQAYLEVLAQLPTPLAPSPEQRLLILEALCRVEAMLRSLPARTRDVFLLAQFDGLTYAQIAERLGLSLITVKRHMRQAFGACLALDQGPPG